MKKPIINFSKPSQQQLNNLLKYYQTGRYDDAEKSARSLSLQYPHDNFSWKILGAVLKKTGRLSEAVSAGKKTIEIDHSQIEKVIMMSQLDNFIDSLPQGLNTKVGEKFVMSHPIAGSEKSGLANYNSLLFKDKLVVLSAVNGDKDHKKLNKVKNFWELLG